MSAYGQERKLLLWLIGPHAADAAHLEAFLRNARADAYRIVYAGGIKDALSRDMSDRPALILLDLSGEVSTDLKWFVKLRVHTLEVPLIVLAAASSEAVASETVRRGAEGYLMKEGLDGARLGQAIRSALEQWGLTEHVEQLTRALQASEASLYHIIQSNADGMLIVDPEGQIRFVNPAAEQMLGQPLTGLVGQRFEFPLVPGQTKEYQLRSQSEGAVVVEIRVVETIWEGAPAYLACLRDISERKRLERLKDEFVSKVSHELRTPLTSIKGAVTLMLNKALGEINDEQQDFLQTISHDLDRLAGLINNVLDLSKMEAGKMTMTPMPLEMAELVEQTCRSYQPILGRRTIVKRLPFVPPVWADRNLILQVITNLLGNAIKFTPEEGTITFALHLDGEAVALSVIDSGPGIPKDVQAKLFQKFVQGESPAADRPTGTGLGLAISREIVELHHGTIAVSSELGCGSAFTFTLPVYDATRVFGQIIEELKAAAEAEHSEIALLLVDVQGQPAGPVFRSLEDLVRKSVSRNDRVIMVEPMLLAVVAVADQPGAAAMRQRLEEVCRRWGGAHGAKPPVVAVATTSADGARPAILLQRAKAQLRAQATDEAESRRSP